MKKRPRVENERPRDERQERVDAFAHELVVALVDLSVHAPTSAPARARLDAVRDALGAALAAGVTPPLRLEVCGPTLCWEDADLPAASLQAGRLVRILEQRSIRALCFDATVDAESIGRFLDLLSSSRDADLFRSTEVDRVLRDRGVHGISIERDDPANPTPQSAVRDASGRTVREYQNLTEAVQESHVAASRGHGLEIDRARGLVERTVARMGEAPSDLLALSVYDDIDRFTVGHSVRVALIALEIARAAGASEEQLLLVGTAGLLHDVGKSLVPQEVLFKQGRLDEEEWSLMAQHPRLGAAILLEQDDVHPSAIGAAFCHHMAPGNRGYPDPVARFDPSGISRLIRVCDVFEALTAVRPYKRDLTPLEAMAIMNRQADGFDPRWLRFFFRTLGIYPVGTRVRLDTGERGLVIRHGPNPGQPFVRLDESPDGSPLAPAEHVEFVVGEPEEGVVRKIAAVIRRRSGVEFEDPSERAVVQIQHACLGGIDGSHDSCTHG